jgi:hypothetical protein
MDSTGELLGEDEKTDEPLRERVERDRDAGGVDSVGEENRGEYDDDNEGGARRFPPFCSSSSLIVKDSVLSPPPKLLRSVEALIQGRSALWARGDCGRVANRCE